ncbi:hypothetical protein PF003_g24782 [Phytophthora fragariae]|nr:hypothetical protein PF003_g24782 [Phytophthora fragariae]
MQMQIEDVVRLDSERESVLVQPGQSVAVEQPPAAIAAPQPVGPVSTVEEAPSASGDVDVQTAPVDGLADSDTVARHRLSRFGRKRKRNSRLNNFKLHYIAHKMVKVLQCEFISPTQSRLHSRDVPVPATYKLAIRSKFAAYWLAAIAEELESLRKHGVWQVVDRSAAGKSAVITNKWVFGIKKDENGFVKRFKARLVIHGFKQKFGDNYNETFAPVIRFDTIRVAIYFAVQRRWSIFQYDVKTAFLYGKLTEEVFMEFPQGNGSPGNKEICKLIKFLYGLKQAPHVWNKTLHRHLVALGFTRLESDHGLYSLLEKGEIVMLLTVYVDDLLLMGESSRCEAIARKLAATFELVELGPVKYLLGVEVSIDREKNTVFFSQTNYVEEILRRFHMHDCHGAATPEATTMETASEGPAASEPSDLPYREIVGAFQYLVSGSRPDIAHVVRRLGQYMACFGAVHYAQAKRVLRYLQTTKHFGLSMVVTGSNHVDLLRVEAYSDADYANDKEDRQSVSGYVTMVNGSVVSYGSRKQGLNAQSTMESEYIAMNEGARDIMWLRGLCDELRWRYDTPKLWCDNTAAIALSKKPRKHNGSKHIENRFHYVRNLEDRELLEVQHCRTDQMTADILTKPLARVKFEFFRSLLGVVRRNEQGGAAAEMKQSDTAFVAWMRIRLSREAGDGSPKTAATCKSRH